MKYRSNHIGYIFILLFIMGALWGIIVTCASIHKLDSNLFGFGGADTILQSVWKFASPFFPLIFPLIFHQTKILVPFLSVIRGFAFSCTAVIFFNLKKCTVFSWLIILPNILHLTAYLAFIIALYNLIQRSYATGAHFRNFIHCVFFSFFSIVICTIYDYFLIPKLYNILILG